MLVLLATLGLLAAGLARLFELQFSGGEGYPPGSSLRADPEGSMILYESLRALPGLKVSRGDEPLEKTLEEVEASETVLFLLNLSPRRLERDRELAAFVRAGGTVVATPRGRSRNWEEEGEREEEPEAETSEEDDEEAEPLVVPLGLKLPNLQYTGADPRENRVRGADALPSGAPRVLDWPVGRVFNIRRHDMSGLEVLYRLDGDPVMLEIRRGEGRVLAPVDAFLFSNQAMYTRRNSEWIAWLIGDARAVVFGEYHFGLRRPSGLAALMWSYRLRGLVFGLGLPFLLLIWHGAAPLLPALAPEEEPNPARQSRLDGLRDLLARHVPASNLLALCVKEWKDAFLRTGAERKRFGFLEERADSVLADPDLRKSSHLSAGYQRLHNILTQKRTRL